MHFEIEKWAISFPRGGRTVEGSQFHRTCGVAFLGMVGKSVAYSVYKHLGALGESVLKVEFLHSQSTS